MNKMCAFLKKQLYFENALFDSTGKKIKLSAVVDKNLSNADFYQISDEEKNFKCDLFKEILTTVGVGAKTNVGYGQLKVVPEETAK